MQNSVHRNVLLIILKKLKEIAKFVILYMLVLLIANIVLLNVRKQLEITKNQVQQNLQFV